MVVTQALIVDEMDAMKCERFRCFRLGPCFCLPNHVNVPNERDVERSHIAHCTLPCRNAYRRIELASLSLARYRTRMQKSR